MNKRPHGIGCENGNPCHSCYQKAWYRKTLKAQRALKMEDPEYREKKLAKQKEQNRKNYSNPDKKEKMKQATKRWVERNRERVKDYVSQWTKDNSDKSRAKTARRRAARLLAMPLWVSKEDLYAVYKNCPVGMEVDHIVPLQGKDVCGLHVPWNLQYLSPVENRAKGNKMKVGYLYC